jgi:hypothetical protein
MRLLYIRVQVDYLLTSLPKGKTMREVQEVKIHSIDLFHHLLRTAPFGVLRGMGAPHVSDCQCRNCKSYRKVNRNLGASDKPEHYATVLP